MSNKKKKNKNPGGILEWIVDFFVSPISNAVKGLSDAAAKIVQAKPADQIIADIRAPFDNALPALQAVVKPKSPKTPAEAGAEYWKTAKDIDANINLMIVAGTLVEAMTLGQVDTPQGLLLNTPLVRAIGDVAYELGKSEWDTGFITPLRRHWNRTYRSQIPQAFYMPELVAKGTLTDEQYKSILAENGLADYIGDAWRLAAERYPEFPFLAELKWRGVIDDATFDLALQRSAIPESLRKGMKTLLELIPPSSDLVTMVVREAFDPAWVTPAPSIFATYMAKKGFNKDWSDRYWTMHWIRMPLAQAYDNYYRGYWTAQRLKDELKWADFHPGLHDDIVNVAYQVPSIRELGYGYDVKAYTEDDIIRYRRWGGLSPDDAKKAAGALVDYRLEAEREALRREYMQLYARGKLSDEQLKTKMDGVWAFKERTALWIERSQLYKERLYTEPAATEPRGIPRATAQFMFESGIRDEDWLRVVLEDINTAPEAVEAYVDQSKYRMKQRQIEAEKVTPRLLTLAQLRGLYYAGKIDEGRFHQSLLSAGFTSVDADLLTQLAELERPKPSAPKELSMGEVEALYNWAWLDDKMLLKEYQTRGYSTYQAEELLFITKMERLFPVMRTLYRNSWIKSTDLFNWLVEVGLPKDRADILMRETIKAEGGARTVAEKDLTKAEIIKGVKNGIFTPQQGVAFLQDIGYDEQEAWYLLYINAVVARGDPQGYWEMRKVTEQYKKSQGLPSKDIPDELLILEIEQRKQKDELERLKKEGASEVAIGEAAVKVANIESRMRKIMAELKLA